VVKGQGLGRTQVEEKEVFVVEVGVGWFVAVVGVGVAD
jgi:hypothetical protein